MQLMWEDRLLYDEKTQATHNNDILPPFLRDRMSQDLFRQWLVRRSKSQARDEIKLLSNYLEYPYDTTATTLEWLMRITRAISVEDHYWLKAADEQIRWHDVNPIYNSKSNVLIPVLLDKPVSSKDITFQTVEYSTGGSVEKVWSRIAYCFYMYKTKRWEMEVKVSKILDALNVNHVDYVSSSIFGIPACKCVNMSDMEFSRIPASELRDTYTKYDDFLRMVIRHFPTNFYVMCVVDYLICNQDRHGDNWGFFMDNNTGSITSLHPLFDHNWSFGKVAMQKGFQSKVFTNYSLKEVAVRMSELIQLTCDKTKLPELEEDEREYFLKACEVCNVKLV